MSADTTSSTHTPSGSHAAERIVRRPEPRNWPKRVRGKRRKKTTPWAKATLLAALAVLASVAIMWVTSAHPRETVVAHVNSIALIGALVLAIVAGTAIRVSDVPFLRGIVYGLIAALVVTGAFLLTKTGLVIAGLLNIQHITLIAWLCAPVLLVLAGVARLTSRPHVLKATAVALVLSLVTLGGWSYAQVQRYTNNLKAGESLNSIGNRPNDPTAGKALNILVMGVDTRACAGCQIDNQAGGDASDTTILIHVAADRSWAVGVSIPRDSMVDRPAGCKDGRGTTQGANNYVMWNAAYSLGGYDCTIRQFEATTHLRLSHYVVVNFASFQSMVDSLGGVTVCIPKPWNDAAHGIVLPAGTQKLSGIQALDYVRERYGIGDGSDIGRTHRQQAFIGSMISEAMSGETLSDSTKLPKFLDAATKGLTLDPEFKSLPTLVAVAGSLRNIGLKHIQFITVPFMADPRNPKNRIVWAPDATKIWDLLRNDRPLSSALSSFAINAGSVPSTTTSASPTATPSSQPTSSAHPSTGPSKEQLASVGLCS